MSGISEIKRKTKLSMDEMYENQPVGKMDNQKEIKEANQPENKPGSQLTGNPSLQKESQPFNNQAGHTTIQPTNIKQEAQVDRTTTFPITKQQTQKIPTYKMTFNLTEDIYKAFNDLYANRMLQGRKTEKSEMICEAIQWLLKMEEQRNS